MDDILRDFVIETTEAIDVVDSELVRFEQEPNNGAVLAQIFRLVHTVKGTCGFLGLPRLEALAHAAETVIGQFRDGVPVTTQAVSLILATIDQIKLIIGELERNAAEPEGEDAALIKQLEDMARLHIEKKSALVSVPEHTTGSLVYQVLERRLRPGEVSLDDLELAFRDAPGPGKARAERMSEMFAAVDQAREAFDAAPAAKPTIEDAKPEVTMEEAAKHTDADFAVYERLFHTESAAAPELETPSQAAAESADAAHAEPTMQPESVHLKEEKGIPAETAASKQTLRVAIDTIDHLMTMVSELVLTRNQLLEIARRQGEGQFKIPLQRLSSITAELQEAVMKTRMQPIAAAWAKLPRLVRDLSVELKKQIDLETSGAETEIDRHVLDLIRDPLVHMIRNAADHGLESSEERVAKGKPRAGKIKVSALQEGGYIILEVSDDGKGLDLDRVAKRALTMGLATEEQLKRMNDSELARFIFKAGFSTAREVTSVSGRGVGMDVVNNNVEQIGGSIDIRTKIDVGTTISIKIPVTLAIASALVVEACGQRFAIPQLSVVELVRAGAGSEVVLDTVNGSTVLRLRNELLPVGDLGSILRLSTGGADTSGKTFIVVCQVADRRFGLIVDSVVQTEEIVVKPTSAILHSLSTYSGVTILGDGSVVMILDPAGMGRELGIFAERREDRAQVSQLLEDSEPLTSLLVFRSGENGYKAVPLELVTRLEEIEGAKIEMSGGQSLIQYRGKLMPLIPANSNGAIGAAQNHHVLVFARGQRSAGLVVDQIIDIVEERLEITAASETPGLLGSAIIGGRATDIIDVAHFLPFEMDGSERDLTTAKNPAVLIVDDSAFFRAMLAPVVKAAGYRVFSASDAASALQVMSENKIDAVVIDLDMPRVSGFEFASRLRLEKFGADVPLIGLAEKAGVATVRTAREKGFVDLVGKFDRQGLIASLNDFLQPKSEAA
ncbi:MAG: hybrid sensor histidine kinase/response regulator [Beijerinckiaceae bacterium]|nr:hybrid sensor histidine kinase/response regulator [Beijerinckiaceae bacterium]